MTSSNRHGMVMSLLCRFGNASKMKFELLSDEVHEIIIVISISERNWSVQFSEDKVSQWKMEYFCHNLESILTASLDEREVIDLRQNSSFYISCL